MSSSSATRQTLSEFDSKRLLARYGMPITVERLVPTASQAAEAAAEIGFPVVLKGCGPELAHKTEMDMVRVGIRSAAEATTTAADLLDRGAPAILVQEFVKGERLLLLGMVRDEQFGACVTVGLGGIIAEVIADSALRVAPIEVADAHEMLRETLAYKTLVGFRGMPDADLDTIAAALVGLGRMALEHPEVLEADVNPLVVRGDGSVVAADALVVLSADA